MSGAMILTGAPGSGKTSVLDALCTRLEIDGVRFGAFETEQLARGWPWLNPTAGPDRVDPGQPDHPPAQARGPRLRHGRESGSGPASRTSVALSDRGRAALDFYTVTLRGLLDGLPINGDRG